MTAPGDFSSGDVLSAADMNGLPGGWTARNNKTTDTSLTTSDTVVNTITVDTEAGRRYLVVSSWWTNSLSTTLYVRNIINVNGTRIQETNQSGSTSLQRLNMTTVANFAGTGASTVITSEGATNTGTATALGAGGRPALLYVFDMGPA